MPSGPSTDIEVRNENRHSRYSMQYAEEDSQASPQSPGFILIHESGRSEPPPSRPYLPASPIRPPIAKNETPYWTIALDAREQPVDKDCSQTRPTHSHFLDEIGKNLGCNDHMGILLLSSITTSVYAGQLTTTWTGK